ncbi:hypothetical protein D3C84_798070 [compost metagenome]
MDGFGQLLVRDVPYGPDDAAEPAIAVHDTLPPFPVPDLTPGFVPHSVLDRIGDG